MEPIAGLFSLFIILFVILFFIVMILSLTLWVLMLIDVVQRDESDFPNPEKNTKVIWILVVSLAVAIGAGVYYFSVKKRMDNLFSVAQDESLKPG